MIDLKQTDSGIYYLHDYVPVRQFRRHSETDNSMSRKIWDYKNGEADALNLFTNELMEAVSVLSKKMPGNKIGLVAVPPSKVGKASTVRTSIWNMANWSDKGIALRNFNCNKTIYDYGNLLTRSSDISTAHEGRRSSYEEQYESISCARDRLSRYWTTFIILDDVTTQGTSMDVCRDILIEHGAVEKYIYRMAIAKTI